jgi:hypothetical protein
MTLGFFATKKRPGYHTGDIVTSLSSLAHILSGVNNQPPRATCALIVFNIYINCDFHLISS